MNSFSSTDIYTDLYFTDYLIKISTLHLALCAMRLDLIDTLLHERRNYTDRQITRGDIDLFGTYVKAFSNIVAHNKANAEKLTGHVEHVRCALPLLLAALAATHI